MKFLKPILKAYSLPSNVILVNEDYPIDCSQYFLLLDPNQTQYFVDGYGKNFEEQAAPEANLPKSDKPLQLKSIKLRKWGDSPEKQTPPRTQSQPRRIIPNEDAVSSPGVRLLRTDTAMPGLVQSPQ
jgi:DNA polymerase IV